MPELDAYDTNALMLEYRSQIYQALTAKLTTGPTAQWLEALLAHDVWCAPVQTYDELLADPQAQHNEVFWEVPIGNGDTSFRTVASPFTFSRTPAAIHRGVPDLGAHTAEILGEAAGAPEESAGESAG
jgi:crotonobetainyl-CoA:carnitine CoA-transferase CaiB-like acyl-CoA transferase